MDEILGFGNRGYHTSNEPLGFESTWHFRAPKELVTPHLHIVDALIGATGFASQLQGYHFFNEEGFFHSIDDSFFEEVAQHLGASREAHEMVFTREGNICGIAKHIVKWRDAVVKGGAALEPVEEEFGVVAESPIPRSHICCHTEIHDFAASRLWNLFQVIRLRPTKKLLRELKCELPCTGNTIDCMPFYKAFTLETIRPYIERLVSEPLPQLTKRHPLLSYLKDSVDSDPEENPIDSNAVSIQIQLKQELLRAWKRKYPGNDRSFEVLSETELLPSQPRITAEEYNVRAREALKNPRLRSVRQLAKAIGCSTGLVTYLPAWRAYQEWLERQGRKKPHSPKVVALSKGVLVSEGQNDPELERLIAEQQADYEESPLVSQARKHRRRRKV